jgi:lipoprotein-anchoring transpeptidase ErfK/SrfK
VGIHGVPPSEDYSIGSYASHGCIRMHEWDVEQLYNWVTVGMPIIIKP